MPNFGTNQLLLTAFLVLVVGVGTYVTYVRQQQTLNTLAEKVEARQEEKGEIEALWVDLTENKRALTEARTRWRNRYKTVPDTITSPDVVAYLTELTQTGFRTFDIVSAGPTQRQGYSAHTFDAEGKAFFSSLYRLVWRLENSRPFYRVQNLTLSYLEERSTDPESGRPSMDVLVDFDLKIEAIYGIVDGPATPRSAEQEEQILPVAQDMARSPVPRSMLPRAAPRINPFYPLVFEEVPPNEEGRLNVETAQFVSIVDEHAVFATNGEIKRLAEGDRVYLGEIVEVDASAGRVVARLNKGGIVERVERTLNPESPLRRDGRDIASPN